MVRGGAGLRQGTKRISLSGSARMKLSTASSGADSLVDSPDSDAPFHSLQHDLLKPSDVGATLYYLRVHIKRLFADADLSDLDQTPGSTHSPQHALTKANLSNSRNTSRSNDAAGNDDDENQPGWRPTSAQLQRIAALSPAGIQNGFDLEVIQFF